MTCRPRDPTQRDRTQGDRTRGDRTRGRRLPALLTDARAVTALEYALVAALIAFSTIAAANALVGKLVGVDNTLAAIYARTF